jgi:hypothetical protein
MSLLAAHRRESQRITGDIHAIYDGYTTGIRGVYEGYTGGERCTAVMAWGMWLLAVELYDPPSAALNPAGN